MSVRPDCSIWPTAASTQSAMLRVLRSPGTPCRPGRLTVRMRVPGASRVITSMVGCQHRLSCWPPWMRTSAADSAMAFSLSVAPGIGDLGHARGLAEADLDDRAGDVARLGHQVHDLPGHVLRIDPGPRDRVVGGETL